ncbi:MAG: DNA methyltransferase [Gammaproteobacteria bacterium]
MSNGNTENKEFNKLVTLLKELFQLDQPDLDFGLYRVMHAKADEISRFLDKELLPQVKQAFDEYQSADKADMEKELQQAIEQAKGLGVDPETTTKVRELRRKIDEQGVDVAGLEKEVYDHLYSFFRRYYSEGDFLAKRVYKPGVYAIPYEGEEVKLHWANKDQYYIKTSEYLRDYTFTLKPGADDPMRVHFRLADVAEGEHGNVKAQEGKDRVFILAKDDFIAEEDGELIIRFEYRPATLEDWTEVARQNATAAAAKKPPTQKDLRAIAAERILAVTDFALKSWLDELRKDHIKANGETADYSRLVGHLERYTKRNTFDYFIHKDLGGFLRRELDFFIKNEVMFLDDIENESAPHVEQYLSKIKVIRKIAGKIIDFLAQLEDFQKKLWLKKKFVTETSWCIRLGCIPEEFYPEIAANDAQRWEWVDLHAINEIEADLATVPYSEPLTPEFLKAHSTLMVDTRNFGQEFTYRLLEIVGNVDEQTDGVLFCGENFQSLSEMQTKYRENIECIYIDPPYNTGDSEIPYKNTYLHSSWLALMDNRLLMSAPLMSEDPVLFIAIDDFEMVNIASFVDSELSNFHREMIIINHHPQGGKAKTLAHTHEYMLACVEKYSDRGFSGRSSDDGVEWRPFKRSGTAESNFRYGRPNSFYAILVDPETSSVIRIEPSPRDGNYPKDNTDDGLIRVYPISASGEERVWRRSYESCLSLVEQGKLVSSENLTIYQLIDSGERRAALFSNWVDSRYNAGTFGANLLQDIIGTKNLFSYPKSIHTVGDALFAAGLDRKANILDYFAGSGTTGHAVINLNREDGGRRKFILVEMGDYFDTVLLPRLKKVTFTPEWKDGKPKRLATAEEAERSPRIMKVMRLESYEDALNNLDTRRTEAQATLLDSHEAQGADGLREQYLLRYMLDVETRGSQSLLNIDAFTDPTAYQLKAKRPGSDETREVNVDLLETFNWLIGLTVETITAPRTFNAAFKRDDDPDLPQDAPRRLHLEGRPRQDENGPWWFRTVTGTTPDGRSTLIIWRKLTGDAEQDNLVLDEWFRIQDYSSRDTEFDLIYVNGDNNLENLRQPDETWKVRLIEEDFHRLMFEETET